MKKNEYLQELRNGLNSFSQEERNSAIAYYEEFFEEAGVENEQAVIASLGDPKILAQSILKESGVTSDNDSNATFTPPQNTEKSPTAKKYDNSRNVIVIILLIFAWACFAPGAFGVLIGFIAAVFGVTFGLCVASVTVFAVGIYTLFSFPPTGIFLIGVGLLLMGLNILIIFPLFKMFISAFVSGCKWLVNLLKGLFAKNEVNA